MGKFVFTHSGEEIKLSRSEAIALFDSLSIYLNERNSKIEKCYRESLGALNTTDSSVKGKRKTLFMTSRRQALLYFLFQKGFTDEEAAATMNRDRTTILYHRKALPDINAHPEMYPEFAEYKKRIEKIWEW